MNRIGTSPQYRAAIKLVLLTLVRKSELSNATWDEINFSEALWTIPKERMKRRKPHLVFLSQQAMDIFIALKTFAAGSKYVLPSRYDSDTPMSNATLNRILTYTYKAAQKDGNLINKAQHDCDIWVAGGVTSKNIPALMKLGVTGFIVGRSLFQNQDYYTMVAGLKKAIRSSATV